MKKVRLIFFAFITFIVSICYTGCIKDCKCNHNHTYKCDCDCIELSTRYFVVKRHDWKWNNAFGRYEYSFDGIHEITKHVYEQGLLQVGVFITEEINGKSYEVLKPLPFVQTYAEFLDDGTIYYYTETISYDIMPNSILFSIQASDLFDGDGYLQTYEFKVSIIQ
jgi:hypothetical protein